MMFCMGAPDTDPARYPVDFLDPVWIRIRPDPISLDSAQIRPDPLADLEVDPAGSGKMKKNESK